MAYVHVVNRAGVKKESGSNNVHTSANYTIDMWPVCVVKGFSSKEYFI